MEKPIEKLLTDIQRPGQYIGAEWNSKVKDISSCTISCALVFPDMYEVGMSNVGMRILYGLLNSLEQVRCERFFSPGADLEQKLIQTQTPILSLESNTALSEFDIVGFSLGHELSYPNVLSILNLGNIPFRSSQRTQEHPLIIGGGPCVFNPEPVADFFDLFVIGEGEKVILEILKVYDSCKGAYRRGELSRRELFLKLSIIPGVYVPSLYEIAYDANGMIVGRKAYPGAPDEIQKAVVDNLDNTFYPVDWIVPYVQVVHDRLVLEVMRGCPNRCRFCQARSQYYPLRQRSAQQVLELANRMYAATGYEEMALVGLSVSDYCAVEKVVDELTERFSSLGVSVSLPSVRAKSNLSGVSSVIARVKKTGLTFAPEAGSQRMRALLNKNFNQEEFFASLEDMYKNGYQKVKLYFMVGLPGENISDLDAIVDFAVSVSTLKKKLGLGAAAEVHVSINPVIPKPHTAFQWLAMESLDVIKSKAAYLHSRMKGFRRIKLSFHNPEMSLIEAVLSRGDRRCAAVIERVYQAGARFESWENHFSFSRWTDACIAANLDFKLYLGAQSLDAMLAWSFIQTGVDVEWLKSEYLQIQDAAKKL